VSDRTIRTFTTEFKEQAVLRLEAGEQGTALAAELGVRRKLLYDWRKSWRRLGVAGLNRKRGPKALLSVVEGPGLLRSGDPPGGATPADPQAHSQATEDRQGSPRLADPLAQARTRIAELERLVGRQQVDLDFFRRALRLTDADSPNATAPASTRSSKP
jgi:transposase-like protein